MLGFFLFKILTSMNFNYEEQTYEHKNIFIFLRGGYNSIVILHNYIQLLVRRGPFLLKQTVYIWWGLFIHGFVVLDLIFFDLFWLHTRIYIYLWETLFILTRIIQKFMSNIQPARHVTGETNIAINLEVIKNN